MDRPPKEIKKWYGAFNKEKYKENNNLFEREIFLLLNIKK